MAKKETTYKFGANTAEVDKKLAAMSSKMKDLGRSMQNIGKSMSLYVTAPIMALGAGMAKAAMELEATDAKFQTVFKGMTNEASAFIKEFRKLTPATTAEARNMASGIQDLLVPMGFMREEATKITGELMHVTGALTNFNSGTHTAEDVVRAVQSALTGMYRPLKSLGVQLDETTIKQKAVEYGMAGVGEEISKQVKVQVLLKEIYAQSGDALSAYTKENLDAKTSMGLLRADLSELGVQFGNILLPIINKMIVRIREWIEVFSKLEPQTKKIIMVVGGLAAAIGPLLIALGVIVKTVIPALVAGGIMLAKAWAPLTLIILGVAAAYMLLNKNMKANAEEVDKLVKKNTVEELTKEADELNELIIRLRKEREKPVKERSKIDTGDGTVYRMDNKSLDELIQKELQRAKNLETAIKAKKQADIDAAKAAADALAQQKAIEEALKNQIGLQKGSEKQLGKVAKIQNEISKLEEKKPFASIEQLIEIDRTIAAYEKMIDSLYLIERAGDEIFNEMPKKLEPLRASFEKTNVEIPKTLDFLIDLSGVMVEFISITSTISVKIASVFDQMGNKIRDTREVIIDLGKELSYLATDVLISLAESMGNAFSGGTFEKGLNDMLITVADWAQEFGKMLIAAGIASAAFQKSLAANPLLAIRAGVALIAAATAVKGALSQNPMSGAGSGVSGGGGSGGDVYGYRNFGDGFNVQVTGEIVADGSQLRVILDNENKRLNF